MAKSKSKQEEALQLLDDLDSFTVPDADQSKAPVGTAISSNNNNDGEAEALAFLEEITQKSSEPTRATTLPVSRSGTPVGGRKPTERVRLGGGPVRSVVAASSEPRTSAPATPEATPASAAPTWGWGSVWNTASAAIQQAKTVVDEQVKQLPKNEQARKWGEGMLEYAKTAQLDKLSACHFLF